MKSQGFGQQNHAPKRTIKAPRLLWPLLNRSLNLQHLFVYIFICLCGGLLTNERMLVLLLLIVINPRDLELNFSQGVTWTDIRILIFMAILRVIFLMHTGEQGLRRTRMMVIRVRTGKGQRVCVQRMR